MNNNPLVSIIMNCYNGSKFLKEAIDSVLHQDYENWEIIFWDNGSIDNSKVMVVEYEDERIKYYYESKNVKLGEARNKALEKASGEFIAFLDVDDLWMRNKLSSQIPKFDDEEVGIVFSDTYFINEGGDILYNYYSKRNFHEGHCFRTLLFDYFLSLETVVIRRKSLETLEYWFDPNFNMIEEADFFRRISKDWKLVCVNEPLAKWRKHNASLTSLKPEQFYFESEIMIEKFEKLYDNFIIEYKSEINELKRRMNFHLSKHYWIIDSRKLSRQIIMRNKFNAKYLGFYILTFFPYKYLKNLKELIG